MTERTMAEQPPWLHSYVKLAVRHQGTRFPQASC